MILRTVFSQVGVEHILMTLNFKTLTVILSFKYIFVCFENIWKLISYKS